MSTKKISLARRLYLDEPRAFLSTKNEAYRAFASALLEWQLAFDSASDDVTSSVLCDPRGSVKNSTQQCTAFCIAKQNGVVAGVDEVMLLLSTYKKISTKMHVRDGDLVTRRTRLMSLTGPTALVLSLERTLLNMLGHMSGIATHTHEVVTRAHRGNPSVVIAATRKTRFGLLDKRACVLGGGGAHRLNLSDAVLIKHNHLNATSSPLVEQVAAAYELALAKSSPRFFEVEIGTLADFIKITALFDSPFFSTNSKKLPLVIMCDNMSPALVKKAVNYAGTHYSTRSFLIECSGKITAKNILSYAKTGVDVISMGSLTYAAGFFDVSMRVEKKSN